jgi:hypothetical protein
LVASTTSSCKNVSSLQKHDRNMTIQYLYTIRSPSCKETTVGRAVGHSWTMTAYMDRLSVHCTGRP